MDKRRNLILPHLHAFIFSLSLVCMQQCNINTSSIRNSSYTKNLTIHDHSYNLNNLQMTTMIKCFNMYYTAYLIQCLRNLSILLNSNCITLKISNKLLIVNEVLQYNCYLILNTLIYRLMFDLMHLKHKYHRPLFLDQSVLVLRLIILFGALILLVFNSLYK